MGHTSLQQLQVKKVKVGLNVRFAAIQPHQARERIFLGLVHCPTDRAGNLGQEERLHFVKNMGAEN